MRWSQRFKPLSDPRDPNSAPEAIDPETTEVHGITDADAAREQPFVDFAEEVSAILHGADWGGYYIRGDIAVLQREYDLARLTLDTTGVRLVDGLRLWQLREPRSLLDAYKRFVGDPEEDGLTEHDAGDDATMAERVIRKLEDGRTVKEMHEEAFPGMIDLSGKFQRRDDGVVVFAFGQHEGKPVWKYKNYIHWMLTNTKSPFPADTRRICRMILAGRSV